MAVPAYSKKKKTSARSRVRKYWWLAPVLVGVSLLGWLATGPRIWGPRVLPRAGGKPIKGYVYDVQTLKQEYQRFNGKELRNAQLEHRFQTASDRVGAQDYQSAAVILEGVSQEAAVPVVFNN